MSGGEVDSYMLYMLVVGGGVDDGRGESLEVGVRIE
jgi:hypothetical protein